MAPMENDLTRRRLLALGLALPPLGLALARAESLLDPVGAAAAPLQATPFCDDGDDPTPELTEGPYFSSGSPRRRSLLVRGMRGTRLTITGYVLTTACKPIRRAKLDFWQADASGVYDNEGYRLRGHQFTDSAGRYRLDTIVPGIYTGRTKHIHVKAQRPGGEVLTTQLFFPGVSANAGDRLYERELLLRRWRRVGARRTGRFDFVLAS
jgi:protocatechuate 3,4-dioxygenase beta subunit